MDRLIDLKLDENHPKLNGEQNLRHIFKVIRSHKPEMVYFQITYL